MANKYTPHKWEKGHKITKERLNNIETGIQEAKQEAKEAAEGSASGAAVTVFDLAAMGMPAVEVDGSSVEFDMNTADILNAAERGTVRFKLNITLGALTLTNAVVEFSYFEAYFLGTNRYLVASVPYGGTVYYVQIFVGAARLVASAYGLSGMVAGAAEAYTGEVEVE